MSANRYGFWLICLKNRAWGRGVSGRGELPVLLSECEAERVDCAVACAHAWGDPPAGCVRGGCFSRFAGVWVCGLFCFVVGWGFGVCFVLVGQKNVGWLCVESPVSQTRRTRLVTFTLTWPLGFTEETV